MIWNRALFLYVLIFACLCTSCTGKKDSKTSDAVEVNAIVVSGGGLSNGSEYVGTIVEHTGVSLSFETSGNVKTLRADKGDHVSKGQLLGTVDPASLRDAHQLALSTLRQAEDAYRRFEPLHKQGVVSDIKWVEIQTRLEQAQASEKLARNQLSHTSLAAPFSGVISERTAELGMNVIAGQQVYRLVDIAKVDVKVSVPESEVSAIRVGEKARVSVQAVGGRSYDAVVTEKGVEANAVSHTYDIKLAITSSDGKLMPGMVCSVVMHGVSQTSAGTGLTVPLDAVKLDSDNRRFVWTVEGGKAKMQYVTLGDFVEGGVVVVGGLNVGARVITEGSQKVSQGMSVKIKN